MTNYIKLKPGLFYQNYVFFDVEQYYADNLFIQHKIKVTFLKKKKKEDIPYLAAGIQSMSSFVRNLSMISFQKRRIYKEES